MIVASAAELFHHRGYDNVSMTDVATSVGIGPSALYRHFRGKQDLLATVIHDALADLHAILASAPAASDLAELLAETVIRRRSAGVLWRRELRRLNAPEAEKLHHLAKGIAEQVARYLRGERPQLTSAQSYLLACCALGIADSVSFQTQKLPERAFVVLLADLIRIAFDAPVKSLTPRFSGPEPNGVSRSRREEILAAATKLFAENGFSGVALEDIGSEVGIAGPSIYNHFPSKAEILTAVMVRGEEALRRDLNQALAASRNPAAALADVQNSYLRFAFSNPQEVQILLSEVAHLDDIDRRRTLDAQRAYIDEWVQLIRKTDTSMSAAEARIRTHCSQMMINDVVLIPRVREMAEAPETVGRIAQSLLGIQP